MKINTVLGPIESKNLGRTLMHEHLLCANWTARMSYPDWFDRAEFVDLAVRMLQRLKNCGYSTIVDSTTPSLGRDIDIIREVSEKSEVNVIASTGFYWYEETWLVKKNKQMVSKKIIQKILVNHLCIHQCICHYYCCSFFNLIKFNTCMQAINIASGSFDSITFSLLSI